MTAKIMFKRIVYVLSIVWQRNTQKWTILGKVLAYTACKEGKITFHSLFRQKIITIPNSLAIKSKLT